MKKLIRKNLDELAKTMPVLNEKEQSSCNGGTMFFDISGNFIQQYGSSDKIRIIDINELNNHIIEQGQPGSFISRNSDEWGDQIVGSNIQGASAAKNLVLNAIQGYDIYNYFVSTPYGSSKINLVIQSGNIDGDTELIFNNGSNPTIYVNYHGYSLDHVGTLVSSLKQKISLYNNISGSMSSGTPGGSQGSFNDNHWKFLCASYEDQTSSPMFETFDVTYRSNVAHEWARAAYEYCQVYGSSGNLSYVDIDRMYQNKVRDIYEKCGVEYFF